MCEFCVRQADDEDDGGAAGSDKPREKAARISRNYNGPFRKTPDRLLGMGLILSLIHI